VIDLVKNVMEPAQRFERIEALLHAMAERQNQIDLRVERRMQGFERRMQGFERRMDRSEQRMDRADERMDKAEQRMDRAERRMEKFDQRLEATRKLVQAGIKIAVELEKSQKALLGWKRDGAETLVVS
jgi:DNA repair exonuclease SbcCD ATPase subunit